MKTKNIVVTIAAIGLSMAAMAQPKLSPDNIKEVIKAMTLEEKVNLLVGSNRQYECPPWAAPGMPKRQEPDWDKINAENAGKQKLDASVVTNFVTGRVPGAAADNIPVERLGIPAIILADGPAGLRIDPIRSDGSTAYSTAFPAGNNLASTWNVKLIENATRAMGNEVREYGVDILLAPAMNIVRNPLCGRNFEYFGEDPLLAGKTAAAYIRGLQSAGVGASVKHFAVNNQESWRNGLNVIVSDRALREIYLRGFEIAVKEGKPWTIMSSYNKINGVLASENHWLLTDVLRKEWGWQGSVMTDWWAEENGYRQILAGNDLLMPGSKHQYQEILNAVKQGRLDERQLDWCVENVLRTILLTPTYQQYAYSNKPDLKAHAKVAREAAEESFVLLENKQLANKKNTLPLSKQQKVALFGVSSYDLLVGGSGSGNVNRAYKVSLYDGLKNAGFKINAPTSQRYLDYVKANKSDAPENFWTVPVLEEMKVTDAEARLAARQSGVAIYTIGRMAGEGGDRKLDKGDYLLSDVERENLKTLAQAFHQAGKALVVVLDMGGSIEISDWKEMPDAILHGGLAGQEMGNALADVLCGKVTPSGKLTTTFAQRYEDYPSAHDFPSSQGIEGEVRYDEDVYVGYHHFSTKGIKPVYPFGYGKSYTDFEYADCSVSEDGDSIMAKVTVQNVGKYKGKEVVQLYVSAPQVSMKKPAKELRAFAKTALLKQGQKEELTMKIAKADLASYDAYAQKWLLDSGEYVFQFGASVEDIRGKAMFTLLGNK